MEFDPIPQFLKRDYDHIIGKPNLEGIAARCLILNDGSTSFFLENDPETLFLVPGISLPLFNGHYVRGHLISPRASPIRKVYDLDIYDSEGGKLLYQLSSEPAPKID